MARHTPGPNAGLALKLRRGTRCQFDKSLRKAAFLSCFVMPALYLAGALLCLHSGWDDGAITVAYGRTYFHTGLLSLTPVSTAVEGTSSLLWAVVIGLASYAAQDPACLLGISKTFSAVCFLFFLLLFRRFAGVILDPEYRDAAVITMSLAVTPLAEIANGMEMNLYALLVLLLTVLWLDPQWGGGKLVAVCSNLSILILAIRFESPFLLLGLYVGLAFARPDKRRKFLGLVILDACAFASFEWWRWRTFHDVLPNTIVAKRWVPYTEPGLFHQSFRHVVGLLELPVVFVGPTVAVAALLLLGHFRFRLKSNMDGSRPRLRGDTLLLGLMSGGALGFGLLLGKNWGTVGRMTFAFSPFFVVTLFVMIRSSRGYGGSQNKLLASVLLLQFLAMLTQLPRSLWNSVPEGRVESKGRDLERIRVGLNQPALSVMMPDVGGTALCCDKLRLIDSGLLTNQVLAHRGYAAIPKVINDERPDAIETHSVWQQYGEFYKRSLLAGYEPVAFEDMIVYVRRPLAAKLRASPHFIEGSCQELIHFPRLSPALLSTEDVAYAFQQVGCIKWVR
jgi:hypothetical protein